MKAQKVLFIISILVLVSTKVYSRGKQDTYQVYVNTPDQSIRTSVMSTPVRMEADLERTYYWYSSNRIMSTKGGYDGKLLHGDYSAFYLNNQLKEKGRFKKGLKHGRWITWYENGNIKEITIWKNGTRDGIYKSYTSKGEPMLDARYTNDLLNGNVTSYENGKVLSAKRYKNGEEVIKKTKPAKEKKIRKSKVEAPDPKTKEGINTTTLPAAQKEKKPTLKEWIKKIFTPKSKEEKAKRELEKKEKRDKKKNEQLQEKPPQEKKKKKIKEENQPKDK